VIIHNQSSKDDGVLFALHFGLQIGRLQYKQQKTGDSSLEICIGKI